MQPSAELSIIVPTYNESENVNKLVDLLSGVLQGIRWEVIFVDDNSPDKTSDAVRELARKDSRVRCIQRVGRRGLSSAVIEGFLSSSAPYLSVMDADLQHDESLLPDMLAAIKEGHDMVIASRYVDNASTGTLAKHRVRISQAATAMGNLILDHKITDPMSGFFMLKRSLFENVADKLSGKGFKILLDIVASTGKDVRICELPYHMKSRQHGESKLSAVVVWEFFTLIANKLFGKYLPLRFVMFVTVGLSGVLVHTLTLYIAHKLLLWDFLYAQTLSTFVAMTSNYFLNNVLTFNDTRHKGFNIVKGLVSFYMTCSLGALINISVANMAFDSGITWWVAGILGAAVGAVWNFALSTTFTWKASKAG